MGRLKLHEEISRISIRRNVNETEYATKEYLLESLEGLRTKYDVPLKEALAFIISGRTDSVSLGKENPHLRFHAHLIRNVVHISIQEPSKDVSFQIPLVSLASLQLV